MQNDLATTINWLLAPVSGSHYQAHIRDNIEHYYAQLTKETLRARIRSRGLDVAGKQLKGLFETYAVELDLGIGKVWTEMQFTTFLKNRLKHDDQELATILWRSFYYTANLPFSEPASTTEEQYVDFGGWSQAATSLLRCGGLDQPSHNLEWRRRTSWNRFVTLATRCTNSASEHTDDNGWRPPDMLDQIVGVVRAELPIPQKSRPPPIEEVRPRIQQIFGVCPKTSTNEFKIPYPEMLALLTATMQVDPRCSTKILEYANSSNVDTINASNMARSLLEIVGIKPSSAISWRDFLGFTEKFHYQDNGSNWTFDHKIFDLWSAIFNDHAPRQDQSKSPSLVILQALDYLLPSALIPPGLANDVLNRQARWESTLVYSADIGDIAVDKVIEALTSNLHPMLVVVTGKPIPRTQPETTSSTSDANPKMASSRAVFAILTSSPLWWTSPSNHGNVTDYFVGKQHIILELTTQARAIWHKKEHTKYVDLVHTTTSALSFGDSIEDTTLSSGLFMNLESGVLTLSSCGTSGPYVEIDVGPSKPVTPKDHLQVWKSMAKIQNIEVYNLGGGVVEELETLRTNRKKETGLQI